MFILTVSLTVQASVVQVGRIEGFDGFTTGKLEGVSVSSEGFLRLGKEVIDTRLGTLQTVSAIAVDTVRNIAYIGSPESGIIYQYSFGDKIFSELCDTGQGQVNDLLVKDGMLFAATSPDGAVMAVDSAGTADVWYKCPDRFVWKLADYGDEGIIAATGNKGNLYRITGKDKGTLLAGGTDAHFSALCVAGTGEIYAGTCDRGFAVRVEKDGSQFVMLDSEMDEISSVISDDSGNVFVSAISSSRIRVKAGEQEDELESVPAEEEKTKERTQVIEQYRSVVYKIDRDGFALALAEFEGELIYDMVFLDTGIIVATGPDGGLYSVSSDGVKNLLDKVSSSQISSLKRENDIIYGGCSNFGGLITMNDEFLVEGHYTSEQLDSGNFSSWGILRWSGEMPPETSVDFYARSGNTFEPDATWSEWSKLGSAKEIAINSPSSRYFQWQCRMVSRDGKASPSVGSVEVSYLQRNIPPVVERLDIEEHGIFFRLQGPGTDSADEVLQDNRSVLQLSPQPYRHVFTGKKMFRTGMRTIHWKASDANNDGLIYSLWWKREGAEQWSPLKWAFTENYFFWDTLSVPDGEYRVKLTVSDLPSNPESSAQEGVMISSVFTVDNTFPVITSHRSGKDTGLVITVTDTTGWIKELRCSLDGGEWKVLFPEDGMSDSKTEVYRINKEGRSTVAVNVVDNSGNTASAQFDF